MRPIRFKWGKCRFEIPGELFILLALKAASLLFHNVNL